MRDNTRNPLDHMASRLKPYVPSAGGLPHDWHEAAKAVLPKAILLAA